MLLSPVKQVEIVIIKRHQRAAQARAPSGAGRGEGVEPVYQGSQLKTIAQWRQALETE